MSEFVEPFTTDVFLEGLMWGGTALAIGLVVAVGWRRRRKTAAPIAGALLVAAASLAMPVVRELPDALWQGLAMLTGAGLLFPWARKTPLLPAILAVPGAWWITLEGGLPVDGWTAWLLLTTIVIGGSLASSFDRRHAQRGYGLVLLAVTILGAFTTLPDTEEILVLLGVAIPLVPLAWPKLLAALGAWGAYPAVGMLAWVVAWGGRGRETAIIGAAASLGLLVAEPVARWVSRRSATLLDRLPAGAGGVVLAGLVQVAVVAVTARVAGLQDDPIPAGLIAFAALAVGTAVMALAIRSSGSGRHRG